MPWLLDFNKTVWFGKTARRTATSIAPPGQDRPTNGSPRGGRPRRQVDHKRSDVAAQVRGKTVRRKAFRRHVEDGDKYSPSREKTVSEENDRGGKKSTRPHQRGERAGDVKEKKRTST